MKQYRTGEGARGKGRVVGVFGPLETQVLVSVRKRGRATVAEVHADLSRARPFAYTTVMTTMGRLAEKGLLLRKKEGRRYIYAPPHDNAVAPGARLKRLFRGVFASFRQPAIRYFVESVAEIDDRALADLEEEIRVARKRRPERKK